MSLRTRLAILTSAAVTCAVVIAAVVSYGIVHDQLYQQVDDSLRSRASELTSFNVGFGGAVLGDKQIQIVARAGTVSGSGSLSTSGQSQGEISCSTKSGSPPQCTASQGGPLPGSQSIPNGAVIATGVPATSLGAAGGYTQFVSAQGTKVLAPGENEQLPVTATDIAVAKGKASLTLRTEDVDGTPVRIATAPMASGLAVMVARPLDETDSVLANLRELLFFIAIAGIVLAALLGILVARTTLRPVRRLIAATEHVAGTRDLTRRIDVHGGSELDHLAGSFNRMMEALDRSEETQRRLVADASHELRTPLTSLRTNIEVLAHDRRMPAPERRRLLVSVEGQIERLSDLVTGLIDLARGNEPVNAEADVSLADIATLVANTARAHWPKLTFSLDTDESVVRGDAARLERAIGNLVDNAAKWSPADGEVGISVKRGEVRVSDHGPGVAMADRTHVFERFWRAPSARSVPGSGLGLAIVKQVAKTHGGDVSVEGIGPGATFALRLPLGDSSEILT